MSTTKQPQSILDQELDPAREQLVELITRAYWMEIETVMNYVAGAINPDGIRARRVAQSLAEDIQTELEHAQRFGARIKELYGVVPGSAEFSAEQHYLQPPAEQTDTISLIRGVVQAERGAIEYYSRIVADTDEVDLVTQDMVIEILHEEQGHLRLFEGFLREYESERSA